VIDEGTFQKLMKLIDETPSRPVGQPAPSNQKDSIEAGIKKVKAQIQEVEASIAKASPVTIEKMLELRAIAKAQGRWK